MHWRRTWQPTLVFLLGESQGQRSLVGCHLWYHTESDTTEATKQQQQQQQHPWKGKASPVVYPDKFFKTQEILSDLYQRLPQILLLILMRNIDIRKR